MKALVKSLATAALVASSVLAFAEQHFAVKVTGKGKPVILIPGLMCSGKVWDATVDQLKNTYECHVLTLPGFAGQPKMEGPFLPQVRDEIIAYVKEKKLDRPAVIGHSLGGFMAFSLASTEPDLFGKLIAVDGVPWLLALSNPSAKLETVKAMIDAIVKRNAETPTTQEMFVKATTASLKNQITDPKKLDKVVEQSRKSDPATVNKAATEMMLTDLREAVSRIKSPVLMMAAGGWATAPDQMNQVTRMYNAQVANIPTVTVFPFWKSRHFIMLDEPDAFYREVKKFLGEK